MIKAIQNALGLSILDANRVYSDVLGHSELFEEHTIVVVVVCTFLEKLFDDLLTLLLFLKNGEWTRAFNNVEKLRSFGRALEAFEWMTGESFDEAGKAVGHADLLTDWKDVQHRRNDFVHGNPHAIRLDTTEKAFQLALKAPTFFASLQNRLTVP